MATFKYHPLQYPDSFRLILLQPSQQRFLPLYCTLECTTISQCDREIIDHYTALSYVWGDPAAKKGLIFIQGAKRVAAVEIGKSLEDALKALRDKKREVRIWADALCIDQSNLVERGSQVELMGQIYSTASHTVIYLGDQAAGQKVLEAIPSNTSGTISPWDINGLKTMAETTLLKMPWFSRVWIFQELLLSKDPRVQCGTVRARWTNLCRVLLSPGYRQRSKELQVLGDMNSAISVHKQKLFVHLTARRGLGATNPRDFIFGHLGIAADVEELKAYVKVDYETSCGKTYNDTARYLLEAVGPETLFHHTSDYSEESRVEDLASWAPDWSMPSAGLATMYRNNTLNTQRLVAKENYFILEHKRYPVLSYLGYEVDHISSLSLTLPEPKFFAETERNVYEQAVTELTTFYHTGSGVWWSGDEEGRHRNFNLRGRETQHQDLCRIIHEEWIKVLGTELPKLSSSSTPEEARLHEKFVENFKTWVTERGKRQIIVAGGDSDGFESLMWLYLMKQQSKDSVLTGRRLAITQSGFSAVVSKFAEEGDRIVFLAGSPVAYIVRPVIVSEDENLELQNALQTLVANQKSTDEDGSKAQNFETALWNSVVNCVLVGECYVEGEVGWTRDKKAQAVYTLN
ncbi:HET-domain-containing protein [Mollisia scopiformis]|uniref:HET-domain-containing protein n=1 Tax=Mollisia scopiformis TaxID=149040 RepID=A0A194XNA2_MOLSC|nr:HET-domain-containing protein [Mollisia scopiformis]KUJ21621.1 HET-domain-containing protein [Mollisia scopiformis]